MDLDQLQKELTDNEAEDTQLYAQYKEIQKRLAVLAGRRQWLIQRIWALDKESK